MSSTTLTVSIQASLELSWSCANKKNDSVLFLNLILFVFYSSSFCFAPLILQSVSFYPPSALSSSFTQTPCSGFPLHLIIFLSVLIRLPSHHDRLPSFHFILCPPTRCTACLSFVPLAFHPPLVPTLYTVCVYCILFHSSWSLSATLSKHMNADRYCALFDRKTTNRS